MPHGNPKYLKPLLSTKGVSLGMSMDTFVCFRGQRAEHQKTGC
jgi:hypothetical protein